VLGALLPSKSCRMAAPPILPNLLTVEIEALQGTVGLQCLPDGRPTLFSDVAACTTQHHQPSPQPCSEPFENLVHQDK
jgi:hypothetical protein